MPTSPGRQPAAIRSGVSGQKTLVMSNLHPLFEEILKPFVDPPKMQFNKCQTCGAGEGRAGMLINIGHGNECLNCHDTRKSGIATIHANLTRFPEEIEKTLNILIKK